MDCIHGAKSRTQKDVWLKTFSRHFETNGFIFQILSNRIPVFSWINTPISSFVLQSIHAHYAIWLLRPLVFFGCTSVPASNCGYLLCDNDDEKKRMRKKTTAMMMMIMKMLLLLVMMMMIIIITTIIEIQRMWNVKAKVITVTREATGTISKLLR